MSVCHNTEREHVWHSTVSMAQYSEGMYICHSTCMAQYSEGVHVSMPQYSEDACTPQYRHLGTRLGPDHEYECEN